jgi:hypothetical protein
MLTVAVSGIGRAFALKDTADVSFGLPRHVGVVGVTLAPAIASRATL